MGNMDNKYGKKLPFEVPSGYFESLPDVVMQSVRRACPEDFEANPKKIPSSGSVMYLRIATYVSVAAVVAFALVFLNLFFYGNDQVGELAVAEKEVQQQVYDFPYDFDVTDEEIIEYLSINVHDVEHFYVSME